MTETDILVQKFNNCCFTLSRDDIVAFDKSDNGPINNVIAKIERHCFGTKLYDDRLGLTAEMFYINHDISLKGDVIRIDVNDQDYFQLLLRFCVLLSNDYSEVDALDAFNTFQTKLRGFLEKRGFFTVTSLELKQFQGKNGIMVSSSERGIFKLDFIDKAQFYRDYFNNNYKCEISANKEYVYLMLNSDTSLIKIGTSTNPKYRERTLHSQEPSIYLIAVWCCKSDVETELHRKFSHKRVRGEWFRLTLYELKEIEDFMEKGVGNSN
jgi:hypothetical protein